jgi:hypothetical protein
MIYAAFGTGVGLLALSHPSGVVAAICGTALMLLAVVCWVEERRNA